MKFKVGDRVRIKSGAVDMGSPHTTFMRIFEGETGVIKKIASNGNCLVEMRCAPGYNWWWQVRALEPTCTPTPTWCIIIEGDGNTSRAKYIEGKKIVKEASAKRYHKDKHDPAMAARALIGKMFPEAAKKEEPLKYFTGRVVCVECPEGVWLTIGKIYEIKDGVMNCDVKYVDIDKITSAENLNSRVKKGVKFIEIKE